MILRKFAALSASAIAAASLLIPTSAQAGNSFPGGGKASHQVEPKSPLNDPRNYTWVSEEFFGFSDEVKPVSLQCPEDYPYAARNYRVEGFDKAKDRLKFGIKSISGDGTEYSPHKAEILVDSKFVTSTYNVRTYLLHNRPWQGRISMKCYGDQSLLASSKDDKQTTEVSLQTSTFTDALLLENQ